MPARCQACRRRKPLRGRTRCAACRAKQLADYAAKRAAGVCTQTGCTRTPAAGHSYCPKCLGRKNPYTREWKRKARGTAA